MTKETVDLVMAACLIPPVTIIAWMGVYFIYKLMQEKPWK